MSQSLKDVASPTQSDCVPRILALHARNNPKAIAIEALGRPPLTYGRLQGFLEQFAQHLNSLGIGRHDRVALVMPNGPEMAVAFLTTTACCVLAPLNPAYRAEEFEFYLSDLKVQAVIVPARSHSPVRTVAERLSILVLELSPDLNAEAGLFTVSGSSRGLPRLNGFASPADTALLLHTSGTTSRPKLVPLTHTNICLSAGNVARALQLSAGDRCLNIMPLFHIHGLIGAVLSSMVSGASVVCSPGFVAPQFFDWLEAFHPTWYTAVPTMHQSILQQAQRNAKSPAGQLRLIRSSSAPLPPQVMAELENLFQAPVIESYGMTEASHQMASNPLPPRARKPGSVGVAAGPEIAVVDDKGNFLGPGSVGEIVIRGANVTEGYLDNPDAKSKAFLDGWFRTGDQGYLDEEGYLFLRGRIKEIINRGGEKISPREVDEVLLDHPAVAQALCFAAPHSLLGEEVAAVVVLHEGASTTELELRNFAASRLADFKIPRTILFRKEIPKGPTGKPQRIGLAEKLAVRFDIQQEPRQRDQTAPRTPIEQLITDIAQQVIRLPNIGMREDFFQLGADSILITQVLARVHEATGRQVPLIRFLEDPTIAGLAEVIDASVLSGAALEASAIQSAPRGGLLPLSFAQERMWFLQMFDPGMPAYNRPVLAFLKGQLDPRALESSLTEIVRRHESLRTVFPDVDGRPVQRILSPEPVMLRQEDYSSLSEDEWQNVVLHRSREETWKPFNLAQGPLFRVILMCHGGDEHALLLLTHHILFDDWSEGILFRELREHYRSLAAGEPSVLLPLPIQYADFALWQKRHLEGDYLSKLISYWKKTLANLERTEVATDRPRPRLQTYRGARCKTALPDTLVESLRELSRREGVTLFTTMLAGFQILLRHYAGRDDIAVGTPIAERDKRETEDIIGVFINTLVLRTNLSGNPIFRDLLQRTRETVSGALAHYELPFEKLVEVLKPEREPGRTPFFQILFEFRSVPRDVIRFSGLEVRTCRFDAGVAHFDLSVDIFEEDGVLWSVFDYNTDLFDPGRIERMAAHYLNLLHDVVAHSGHRLSELCMLGVEEKCVILADWSLSSGEASTQGSLDSVFEAQAIRAPDAVAAIYGDRKITYGELKRDASRWAACLRSQGVLPDQPVGICMSRSFEMLAGVLGILKAGGTCVPLDPTFPEERLAFMAGETGLRTILTQGHWTNRLGSLDAKLMLPEELVGGTMHYQAGAPSVEDSGGRLAYLIFTSGSTGRPKAVAMPHGVLLNLIYWQVGKPDFAAGRKTLQFASLSFDVAFQEMFSTWGSGGSLVLISEEMQKDLVRLWWLIDEVGVERLFVPFVALQALAEIAEMERRYPKHLREIITAGEQLRITREVCALFQQIPDCTLENQYGPAETHVVTYQALRGPAESWPFLPPIGRPIAGARVYVLGEFGQPVPAGVAGEIFIGGPVVAHGYLNRPDLTAERFIPSPFASSLEGRLYRTGDLGYYQTDGTISFVGRIDHQVKVRGFRVECGEIEAALNRHPEVRQSAVSTWRDDSGTTRLAAYLVPRSKIRPANTELTHYLKTSLPAYMIPAVFIFLDALPLLPNGKIHLRALPAPASFEFGTGSADGVLNNDLEKTIAGIWQQVLNVRRVGSTDNFFDLGGDSLSLVQVYRNLRTKVRGEYSIIDMFQYPTVAEFARFLENRPADSDARRGAVDRARKQWAFFGQSRRPGGRSL